MTRWPTALVLAACMLSLAQAATSDSASASAVTAPTPQTGGASPGPQAATPSPVPQQPGGPVAIPPTEVQLSNERTLSTWAHPALLLPIYTEPSVHSHEITRTHYETEDGFPEVYLLLSSYTDPQGHEWVKLRIPGRPNGRTGWVLREALGGFHRTRWLVVVDRRKQRLTAYFDGHVRFIAPVGVGKPSTPTPAGRFWIRERFRLIDRSNPYWPYALGTSDYSTLSEWPGGGVVGIHGDFGQPQLIPGDPSHGCIRMRDADIAWLAPRLTLGTPVQIL